MVLGFHASPHHYDSRSRGSETQVLTSARQEFYRVKPKGSGHIPLEVPLSQCAWLLPSTALPVPAPLILFRLDWENLGPQHVLGAAVVLRAVSLTTL